MSTCVCLCVPIHIYIYMYTYIYIYIYIHTHIYTFTDGYTIQIEGDREYRRGEVNLYRLWWDKLANAFASLADNLQAEI